MSSPRIERESRIKHTALHDKHLQLKAKMAEFQGWHAPLQYGEGQEEYYAVRKGVGLLDLSFLGRIEITGPGAGLLLQEVSTRDVEKMKEGSAHYGFLCNDSGYILDDPLLFRLPDFRKGLRFLLCTNAVNTEKIFQWLRQHASEDVEIADITRSTAQLSVQGPRSLRVMEALVGRHFKKIKPMMAREMSQVDTTVLISRTGYTGEHGYELFISADFAEILWNAVMSAGEEFGIRPCGTNCRDVLRIEMGYLSYGNDVDETRNPIEAGRAAFVDWDKEFIGKEALVKIKSQGTEQKIAGFSLLDKGVPRAGGCIFSENREIGHVTSGCQSPHVRAGIGLGYVLTRYAQPGQEIEIEIRDREIAAKVVDLPFYKKK